MNSLQRLIMMLERFRLDRSLLGLESRRRPIKRRLTHSFSDSGLWTTDMMILARTDAQWILAARGIHFITGHGGPLKISEISGESKSGRDSSGIFIVVVA